MKTEDDRLNHIGVICRCLLGFIFIYQGLVPKILFLSETEILLVDSLQWGLDANVVSPFAGLCEILLGLMILFFRKAILPIHFAAITLIFLLFYVAVLQPSLLFEAFNPVTINLVGIGCCYLILYLEKIKSGK